MSEGFAAMTTYCTSSKNSPFGLKVKWKDRANVTKVTPEVT